MKAKKVIIAVTSVILCSSTLFVACEKENPLSGSPVEKAYERSGKSLRGGPTLQKDATWPTQVNGMLSFRSQSHFDQFQNTMESIDANWVDQFISSEETYIIPDEPLDAIENTLRFRSMRKDIEEKTLDAMVNNSFGENNDPGDVFIRDKYIRTVLNPELEVRIGTSVFKYVDRDFLVEIPDGNMQTLDEVRKRGIRGVKGNAIVHELGDKRLHTPKVAPGQAMPTCYVAYTDDQDNCNRLKYTFDAWMHVDTTIKFFNVYIWNFGDGTNITTALPTVHHTYSTFGLYTVTVTAIYTGSSGTCQDSKSFTVNVQDKPICDKKNRDRSIWTYPVSGHAMRCEIWANHGNFNRQYGSRTTHYEWKNNKWKEKKAAEIFAQIKGGHFTNDCATAHSADVSDNEKSNKSTDVRYWVNEMYGHKFESIRSTHKVKIGSTTHEKTVFLPYYCQ